jgi:hypothetical protein
MANKSLNKDEPDKQVQMVKVADHKLTDGEYVLIAEIYASFKRTETMLVKWLMEKYGYKDEDMAAFQFNWKDKTATAYKASQLEVAKDAPPAPVES